jgi:hypothetical protein
VKKRYLLLPCLLLISALALAACGSSGGGDEGEIEEAIETAATSNSPSKCTEVETQNFNEQSTGESGAAATKQCEKEAPEEENAKSVAVSNIEVEGEEATAEVAVTGSSLDGQTLELALVKEEGQWKANEITGFAKFNQEKLVEAIETQLGESEEIEPELASCIVEGIEEYSAEEAEELVLDGSHQGFEELARECS